MRNIEDNLSDGIGPNTDYIRNICRSAVKEMSEHTAVSVLSELDKIAIEKDYNTQLFSINNLRHLFLFEIGREPAEWDFSAYPDKLKTTREQVLNINVYLDNLRSPFNVGSVFRTAESFCFRKIYISEFTPSPDNNRAKRSSMGSTGFVEWERSSIAKIPGPVFALELGGESVPNFNFPESGCVIIGSEELGVGPEGIKRAKKEGGIVSIPLYGRKASINVSVAFGILAHSWLINIM